MSGSPPEKPKPYTLQVDERVWQALSSLPEGLQEKVTAFWRDHLRTNPHHPLIGGVKRLKGEWSEFYQFDVDRRRRMLYRIDDDSRVVYVDWLGGHPQWDKRHLWR